jgi:pantothenate kinase
LFKVCESRPDGVLAAVEVTLGELVRRARRLAQRGERVVLGITGTRGAGNSTLCSALLNELGTSAVLVGMDGFHVANSELTRLGRAERKGAFDTFDVDGYVSLLRRLRDQAGGTTVYAPEFKRAIEESTGSGIPVVADVPLVITEGNYLLLDKHGWQNVRGCLDEVWFLDVDPKVRRPRLVQRRRSFGNASDWVTTVDSRNASVIDANRHRADLVVPLRAGIVDNSHDFDPKPRSEQCGHGQTPPKGSLTVTSVVPARRRHLHD